MGGKGGHRMSWQARLLTPRSRPLPSCLSSLRGFNFPWKDWALLTLKLAAVESPSGDEDDDDEDQEQEQQRRENNID